MNMEEFDDADIKWLKEHHFNKKVRTNNVFHPYRIIHGDGKFLHAR